jgi:Fic family protein
MPESRIEQRNSRALEPELIADPLARAAAEVRNGLRQYDAGIKTVQEALERGAFRLRPSLILALHREALAGISSFAGNYRPAGVKIEGSGHEPVGAHLVPELIEEMCDYVNAHWEESTPLHLAAYIMWRLNWIHPFADGNGRTSFFHTLCFRSGPAPYHRVLRRFPIRSSTTEIPISMLVLAAGE